ncbi:MAG: PhnE/PtxC family ABC transporter permease [Clostridia bacterium]
MIFYKSRLDVLPRLKLTKEKKSNFFKKKLLRGSLILLIVLLLAFWGAQRVGFEPLLILTNLPQALARFIYLYIPPSFAEIDELFTELVTTILLAISAASVGAVLAFFSGLAISKVTGKIKFLKVTIRLLATFIRNVPAAIWAITLLMAFWFGEFLAFIVMALSTYGFMTRLFANVIDETNSHSVEALEATGASYWQIVFQAVLPETLPVIISWALYAVETNIRSATIIGMLAGGGIGYLIGIYRHFRKFNLLFAAVIFIVITILITDQISNQVRKRIL